MPPLSPDLYPGSNVFPELSNPIAQRVYEELGPLTYQDSSNGYVLLRFVEAWTNSMVEIDALVRDTDAGPGWSSALDVERAPEKFLNFLAQFVGITFLGSESMDDKKHLITELVNLKRGSPAASRALVERLLTGSKYMIFNERQGNNAYRYAVRTRTNETPDPAAVERGLMAQKPAGLILDFDTIFGLTYGDIKAAYDTYTLSYVDRTTWREWSTEVPTP